MALTHFDSLSNQIFLLTHTNLSVCPSIFQKPVKLSLFLSPWGNGGSVPVVAIAAATGRQLGKGKKCEKAGQNIFFSRKYKESATACLLNPFQLTDSLTRSMYIASLTDLLLKALGAVAMSSESCQLCFGYFQPSCPVCLSVRLPN